MNRFLIYGLVDPTTSQLKYIGKSTSGLDRPKSHTYPSNLKNKTYKNNWINGLLSRSQRPLIVIIQEFTDGEILYQAEHAWISYFKKLGCKLTNSTDGGSGMVNPPIELRKRIGFRKLHSMETKKRMSQSHGGRRIIDQFNKVYSSVAEASRVLILPTSNICAVLKGRLNKTGGYKFRYME